MEARSPGTDGRGGLQATAKSIFAGLAETYDRTLDYATLFQDRYWKKWIEERFGEPGGRVLDIGAGTLILEERLSSMDHQFFGVDLTEEMLRAGMVKGLKNVRLLTAADAEHLPFPDSCFDKVVSCYVPKYVALDNFAAEVGRVTRHGGALLLYDFVRPRGPAAPVLNCYGQAGLRAAGYLMGLAKMPEAATFRRLPKILAETSWDRDIVSAMRSEGFEAIETERLTAGVVFAYWGRKTMS